MKKWRPRASTVGTLVKSMMRLVLSTSWGRGCHAFTVKGRDGIGPLDGAGAGAAAARRKRAAREAIVNFILDDLDEVCMFFSLLSVCLVEIYKRVWMMNKKN